MLSKLYCLIDDTHLSREYSHVRPRGITDTVGFIVDAGIGREGAILRLHLDIVEDEPEPPGMDTQKPCDYILSIEDVSRAIGKSRDWVLVQIVLGRLDAVKDGASGIYLVPRAALADFRSRFLGYF